MKDLQYSFSAGEIDPEMYGRVDLDAYRNGLALCRDFIVLKSGAAARRPGFRFVGQAYKSATAVRLFPFVGSAGGTPTTVLDERTAVLMEFGELYVRFYTNGARVHDAVAATTITGISGTDTFNGTIPGTWANGDWVTLTGTPEAGLTPLLDQTYELTNVVTGIGGSFKLKHTPVNLPVDASAAPAAPVLLQAQRVYTLASPYTAAELYTLRFAQSPTFLTLTCGQHPARELYRTGTTTWAFRTVSFAPAIGAPAGLAVATTPGVPPATSIAHGYVVTAVADDLVTESLASAVVSTNNDLTLAGNYNTLAWGAVAGASSYRIYKRLGGVLGLIGSTKLLTIVDSNLLVDVATTPPVLDLTLNSGPGNYPSAVSYVDQRRVFANTLDEQDKVWATRNGTDSNLTTSVPARADDALVFKIAAQQANAIQHLVPLNDLVALTLASGFRVFAPGGGALSFDNVSVKPQNLTGADLVSPVQTPTSVLYVDARGGQVREISYDPQGTGRYVSEDRMLFANHLVPSTAFRSLAYVLSPEPVLWAAGGGVLSGMTHLPDYKVYAWHVHATLGNFEYLATVPEGADDVLYAVVARSTGGAGGQGVRYIERMAPRKWSNSLALADAFFVDAGVTSVASPASNTVDRLWHLEGRSVVVLCDGAPLGPYTVTGGKITLPDAYSTRQVGLPYSPKLQTLPYSSAGLEANGSAREKNITQVDFRVKDTVGLKVGQNFNDMYYPPDVLGQPSFNSPPVVFTGSLRVPVGLGWGEGGQVCVQLDLPLPCTILSVTPSAELGD